MRLIRLTAGGPLARGPVVDVVVVVVVVPEDVFLAEKSFSPRPTSGQPFEMTPEGRGAQNRH